MKARARSTVASLASGRQLSTSATLPAAASSSSSSTSTTYTSPLKAGQLPVYDYALEYLKQDQKVKLAELATLSKTKGTPKEALEDLEVSAWVNDPETRWRALNGKADLSKPVYRHLAESTWRKNGPLATLMQRVTQMNVTPDLLPEISPAADLQIKVAGGAAPIEPGVFVLPAETREVFEITAQVYHADERLYTLLLIDPDVPDELNQTYTTYAHLLIPNIPLSSTSSAISTSSSSAAFPYIPPHPQNGTPYHRYTALLFAQPSSSSPLDLSKAALERESFDTRAFVKQFELDPVGVNFFRQKWDKTVSEIYKDVLGIDEPKYGKFKAPDPYKSRPSKYFS